MIWPYVTRPHELVAEGSRLTRFNAAGENIEGLMELLLKGALNGIWRPLLHAGLVMSVQSPASIASVGTNAIPSTGADRKVVDWSPPKKNNLFLITGPPSTPPNWLRFSESRFGAKALRAFSEPLRTNSNRSP